MGAIPGTLAGDALTWETAIRLFQLRCRAQNLSLSMQQNYGVSLHLFRHFLKSHESPQPAKIAARHLRAFLDSIKSAGLSAETVDTRWRHLKTFFRFLTRDGLLLVDPMRQVERPRRERKFVRPFTEEQLKALLEKIDTKTALGIRDYALIVFLADSGARISEALALRIADVDWAGNTATVMGKGRQERRIGFGQAARRALMAWMQRRGPCDSSEPLWINRYGAKVGRVHIAHRIRAYALAAGMSGDRLSCHTLRHFFALQFLRNGGDVLTLQRLLGHSSLAMVRNYVNMTDDDAISRHRQHSPLDRMGPLPNERKRVRLH